jgi:hypothetical protein
MRKQFLDAAEPRRPEPGPWLDLEALARVEVSSEDPAHPVEEALLPGRERGWRAGGPGAQAIRLVFDRPQRVRRIALVFEEREVPRSQEFALRWQPAGQSNYVDVVRQQWNFSPPGTTREAEDYQVDLSEAAALELQIVPDRSGGPARASLAAWRVA